MLFVESIWLSFLLFCLPLPHYAKEGTFPRLTVHTQQDIRSEILSDFLKFISPQLRLQAHVACFIFNSSLRILYISCVLSIIAVSRNRSILTKHQSSGWGKDLQSGHVLFSSIRICLALSQREPWCHGQFNPSNKEWVGIVFQSILVTFKV